MHTIVLASTIPLEIGSIQRGTISDHNLDDKNVAFRVVKEVDEKAYHKQRLEYAPDIPFVPWTHRVWYYEVLMD